MNSDIPLAFLSPTGPLLYRADSHAETSRLLKKKAQGLLLEEPVTSSKHGLLIPVCALACCFCMVPSLWILFSTAPSWRFSARASEKLPDSQSCFTERPGQENKDGTFAVDVERGFTATGRINASTSTRQRVLTSWGEDGLCVQLLISQDCRLEYRELLHSEPESRGHGFMNLEDPYLNICDQKWHTFGVVREDAGTTTLFVDGFPIHTIEFKPELPSTCHGTLQQHLGEFDVSMEVDSLCIFDHALTRHHVVVAQQTQHFLTSRTTTTTSITVTRTATSTATTTTGRKVTLPPGPTFTSSTSTVTTVTTSSSTVTSTSITATSSTSTTHTATSTSTLTTTSITTTTRTTTTKTMTFTTTPLDVPMPVQSGGGERTDGHVTFAAALLKYIDKEMSITIVFEAQSEGVYTSILSWGTEDAKQGCVSLRLDRDGNLEYGELPAEGTEGSGMQRVWTFAKADPPLKLDDGKWHRATIARNQFGIVYMYADAVPVGQDIMPSVQPKPDGAAQNKQTCEEEPGNPRPFVGVIGGFRFYSTALSAPQVMQLPMAKVEE